MLLDELVKPIIAYDTDLLAEKLSYKLINYC